MRQVHSKHAKEHVCMFKNVHIVDILLNDSLVGKLALTPDGLSAFEYDINFLKTGFSISPFYLPLQQGLFIGKDKPFNGLFGVFNVASPMVGECY